MKIKYLGTGAAEGIPAVFCECRICKNARRTQGKEIRSRMQALIDDYLLIDFGPDTFWHSVRYGIELSKIDYVLITHEHGDHLFYHDLVCRKSNRFLEPIVRNRLTVFGSCGIKNKLHLLDNNNVTRDGNVVFQQINDYEEIFIGQYSIIALPAVHGSDTPLIYAIISGQSSILYCHDSDILDDEVLNYLKERNVLFDVVSMDCTEGKKEIDYIGHMNFKKNCEMKKKLLEYRLVNDKTIFVVSHFSHNGLVTHEEAENIAASMGFIAAYDGLEVNI